MTKHLKEAERLRKIIEAFPKVTITVLGDLVADEFVFGEISRVSREAPVLILKHRERTVVPGGGANAVNNLADLGVNVLPVGAIGEDEPGRLLMKLFRHKRIPISGVLKDKSYTTVTKTRILAGMTHNTRQQVVRVDLSLIHIYCHGHQVQRPRQDAGPARFHRHQSLLSHHRIGTQHDGAALPYAAVAVPGKDDRRSARSENQQRMGGCLLYTSRCV